MEIVNIDELREIRRRLAEEQQIDPVRYAMMLLGESQDSEVEGTEFTTADVLDRVMANDDAADSQLAEWQQKYGNCVGNVKPANQDHP